MKKKHQILLEPKDFIGSSYTDSSGCPLAKATTRYFKSDRSLCDDEEMTIIKNDKQTDFEIKNRFNSDDYDFVKEQYEKDPKMLKARYYVTLIEK